MLSSVLNGDVIRSEKQRLGSTDSTRKRGDPEERYAIWLGIKANKSGRRLEDEKRFLEEFRKTEVDRILEDVVRFEVKEGEGMPSAYDQVVAILDKVELVESIYQSHRAVTSEKPIYASLSFQYNLDALISWLSITGSLRMQLQILKNWTGSETLSISAAGDRSFIERILKESGVKGTFERRIMSVLKGMVRRTKQAMTTNAAAFRRMRLPTHIEELRQLAQFPSNLLEEFLKLRLEYTENLIKPVGAGGLGAIAELVEDSSISLGLAARIKEETLDLDTPADGWTITNSLSATYDSVFLASLRFYFRLLNWRLRSSAETVFFKEVEMLETEWEFLTEQVAPWLQGGDMEIAEQFCKLEEELLRKVNSYFQAQMSVAPGSFQPGGANEVAADGSLSNANLAVPSPSLNNPQVNVARWYKSRVLENVRARSRKLLRFMKSLISEFELAAEYLLMNLDDLISRLQATGHILIDVTGSGKGVTPQGYLVFASPSLLDRPAAVKKLLRACSTRYENFREDIGDGYVLLVSPGRDKHITWRGGKVMKLNDPASAKGYRLKPERVRLVADNGELLVECRRVFEAAAGSTCVKLKKESRAHVYSVHMALKGVKRTLFNLTEVVLGSVRVVRDLIRKMNFARTGEMGVLHDLIQEWFIFASDFGNKALRHVGGLTRRKTLQRSFVRLGIEWLDFVVVDCVNTDKRTYRWSLIALEFAMKLTAWVS
jgi:mitogen-activated protein kinase kinase kinase